MSEGVGGSNGPSRMNAQERRIPPAVPSAAAGDSDDGGIRYSLVGHRPRILTADRSSSNPNRDGLSKRGNYFDTARNQARPARRKHKGHKGQKRGRRLLGVAVSMMLLTMLSLLMLQIWKTTITFVLAVVVGAGVAAWDFRHYWQNSR